MGENFDIITTHNFEFNLPNLIKSTPVKFKISAAARSGASSTFNIKYNTTNILTLTIPSVNLSSYTSNYANIVTSNTTFLSSTDLIPIHINYNKSGASSEGWLDYITINGTRELRMTDNQLLFRYFNAEITPKTIEFTLQNTNSATRIWNVTNPHNPLNNAVSALQPDNSRRSAQRQGR